MPVRTSAQRYAWWTTRVKSFVLAGTDVPAHYFLPPTRSVSGRWRQHRAGDVIARIPQEGSKTRDITGGLPRVADLFEAVSRKSLPSWQRSPVPLASVRKPKASVVLVITHRRQAVADGSDHYEALIPKWRHMTVFEGEHVEKGEVVSEGPENPHDILRLKGVEALGQVYRQRRSRTFTACRV